MKIVNRRLGVLLGLSFLLGCGSPSNDEVSVKKMSMEPQKEAVSIEKASLATVTNIATSSVQGKPGVTRVVMTLDKKAPYSTSREGAQLIVNVLNAGMESSLKQLEVRDPVVKSIMVTKVGNSVKGVVDLVSQDVAYAPSTSTDPFRIFLDVWQISPETGLKQSADEKALSVVPAAVQSIDVDTSGSMTEKPSSAQVKEVTLSVPQPMEKASQSAAMSTVQPSNLNVPAQLEWFSEKLSEVLQERERIKQDLLEAEKDSAVKNSMIQVLERKLKEANNRIVELEEEFVKAKSRTSLAEQNEQVMLNERQQLLTQMEQNEQAMLNEFQQVLNQLEQATGRKVSTVLGVSDDEKIKSRSENILSSISTLQKESTTQIGSLEGRIDALIQNRDELRTQNETYGGQVESLTQERDRLQTQNESYAGQVASMQGASDRLSVVENELRVKDLELARLRKAVGDAAKLAMGSSEQRPATGTVPQAMSQTLSTSTSETEFVRPTTNEGQNAIQVAEDTEKADDVQLVLADLVQQQQLLAQVTNPEDYILGPDDVVQVKVLNEENLDKTVTVSSDGFITYPLLGDLRVDGLTTAQLDAQISSLLARDFLVDPEVMVEVVKQRSKKVYIMGAVKQPGYHELQGDQKLLSTLLSAGGPLSFDAEVRILRLPKQDIVGEGSTETLAPMIIDLNSLFVQGDQTQNIVLQDGDVLMVAPRTGSSAMAGTMQELGPQQFYVVGSVVKPGIYNYKPDDTVLDAILRAGGFTEFASRNGTKLVRELDGTTKTIQVKMKDVMEKGDMDKNVAIMPGDMLIVPESFF